MTFTSLEKKWINMPKVLRPSIICLPFSVGNMSSNIVIAELTTSHHFTDWKITNATSFTSCISSFNCYFISLGVFFPSRWETIHFRSLEPTLEPLVSTSHIKYLTRTNTYRSGYYDSYYWQFTILRKYVLHSQSYEVQF